MLQLQSMEGSRKTHAFDMAIPDLAQSNDALLIQVDPGMTPTCTFVPRQLNREQMTSIFPESWITNILGRNGTMQAKRKKSFRRKKWKFLRRKQFKGRTSKVCFVCRRSGHFVKNCPKKGKSNKAKNKLKHFFYNSFYGKLKLLGFK